MLKNTQTTVPFHFNVNKAEKPLKGPKKLKQPNQLKENQL